MVEAEALAFEGQYVVLRRSFLARRRAPAGVVDWEDSAVDWLLDTPPPSQGRPVLPK